MDNCTNTVHPEVRTESLFKINSSLERVREKIKPTPAPSRHVMTVLFLISLPFRITSRDYEYAMILVIAYWFGPFVIRSEVCNPGHASLIF